MSGKFNSWYTKRTTLQQVIIYFGVMWLWWLFIEFIDELIFSDSKTPSYRIFHALFMALGFTLWLQWKKIKSIGSRKGKVEIEHS